VRKASVGLLAVTVAGAILGAWMAADGLHVRLYGEFLRLFGSDLPTSLAESAGLAPQAVAWPLLVIGLTWFGALSSLWLGHKWGVQATIVLAVLSLLYVGPGTILGLVVLAGLWGSKLRRPLGEPEA